jgi:hypothetical protein
MPPRARHPTPHELVGRSGNSAHVIRIDRRTRRVTIGCCLFTSGVVAVSLALSLTGIIHNPNLSPGMATLSGICIIGGVVLAVGVSRSHVVLSGDVIEVVRLVTRRRLRRSEIVARRFHAGGWRTPPYHVLITRSGPVKLPPALERDRELQAMLREIPLSPS